MKTVINWTKRNYKYALFVFFCSAIMLMQFQINPYFDDYGDLSLSYAWDGNSHGMSYSIFDVFRFCVNLYFKWTGRIATTFIGESMFSIGGWSLLQIANGLAIIIICISSGIIVADSVEYDLFVCMDITLLLFGLYSIVTLQSGFYWYAAFISYTWPAAPILAAFAILLHFKKHSTFLIGLLFFVCGFSDEQYAVMLTGAVITWTVTKYLSNKFLSKQDIFFLVWSLIVTVIDVFAPGNFARANDTRYVDFYNKSFIERIVYNLKILIQTNFGRYNIAFVLTFTVALTLFIYYRHRKNIYLFTGLLACLIVAFAYLKDGLSSNFMVVVLWGWFIIVMILTFWHLISDKKYGVLSLLIGAIFSQGMMLIVPAIPNRTHIPMEIVMNMLIALMIAGTFKEISDFAQKYNKAEILLLCAAMLLISLFCVFNFGTIFAGYHHNMEIHKLNHYKLMEAKQNYAYGIEPKTIRLYKLYDDKYAGTMPYISDSYMELWMCNYYEIPNTTEFYWGKFGEDFSYQVKDGDYWPDRWLGKSATIEISSNVKKKIELEFYNSLELTGQIMEVEVNGEKEEITVDDSESYKFKVLPGITEVTINAKNCEDVGGRPLSVLMEVQFK